MVDRYLLRYFLAVIDQGNFSRAARHCNVSQPTLSVGIAKLEHYFGAPLFIRSNQRVELTEAGSRLQGHARRIEREFNLAQQTMRQGGGRLPLRIGILESIPDGATAAAVAASKQDGKFRLELKFGTERDLATALGKQRIDVALTIVERGGSRFIETPLVSEGYRLALAGDHPFAGQEEIAAEELANETMIVRRHCEVLSETSRHFLDRGVRPHLALRVSNDERTLRMVGAGLGVTVMPSSFRAPDVVRPKLSGFSLSRTLGWAMTSEKAHLLAERPMFIEAACDAVTNFAAIEHGGCRGRG